MRKIDTSAWRRYRLSDVFRMANTKSIVQKDIVPDSGIIPYVTAQAGNNGVMTYVSCPDTWVEDGNCIMIGGKTLTFSYQAAPFCSNDSHNIALYAKNAVGATEPCYLFVIAALKAAMSSRYSWGDSISMERMKDETFFLPADANGNPDWAYMESYMCKMMRESEAGLENLRQANDAKHSLDLSGWKRFHLYDDGLFDIDMGTKLDKAKMTEINPEVNFVGRANSSNGITARVDRIDGLEPYQPGYMTLSLGGEYLGSCFIQPDVFYTSQNVVVLIPKWDMPFSIKQFLSTMIFRESRTYYKAFLDELNRHIKRDFSFYLPVTSQGEPDWQYMDARMRSEMSYAQTVVSELACMI